MIYAEEQIHGAQNLGPPKKLRLVEKYAFFLGHLGAPRAPLSTSECCGMFVGALGMIVGRYQRRAGRVRAL